MTSATAVSARTQPPRRDRQAMWAGVAFAFIFTAIIYLASPLLEPVRATLLPDHGTIFMSSFTAFEV